MKKTLFLLTGVLFVLLFLGCPNATETPKSNNADLQSLTVSTGTLSPAFSPTETKYSVTVSYVTTSLTITGVKSDSKATMTPKSGEVTVNNLQVGVAQTATITVKAEEGTEKNYAITVTREASNNADLQSLTVSTGTLSPAFSPTETSYTVTVPYATTSLTITGVKSDSKATIDPKNGVVIVDNLEVGKTMTTIKVKAEDGTEKNYTITVTREAWKDVTLSFLLQSTGSLNPDFSPDTTDYTVIVPNSVTSITVTGRKSDDNATMDPFDGNLLFENLSVGTSDEKTIKVTSQDGTTTKEYKVKVLRQSNVAMLSGLTTSTGTLSPVFNAATTSYTVMVPNSVTNLIVTGKKFDANAMMDPPDGNLWFMNLSEGSSDEKIIKVTSEDGSAINEYKVKVLRQSTVATLSNLVPSTGILSPTFNESTMSYTVIVPNNVTSLIVTGMANATMDPFDGNLLFENLSVGTSSEQTIKVTLLGNNAKNEYKVKVYRQSNDATLSDLTTSTGSLSPTFSAATTNYTVTVPYATTSLTVTGTKSDANATMDPPNGELSFTDLSVGTSYAEIIKVTSEDGTKTKEYKVKVLRQPNDATLLDLIPSESFLIPFFSALTMNYTVTVPYATTSLTVTGTKSDANDTMDPPDGKLSFTDLSVGTSDEKTITVISQDGSVTKVYKVKVLRQNKTIYISENIGELMFIPAGSFQRDATTTNISKITKAYSLSKYQITRQQFLDIMGEDPSDISYSTGMNDPVQMVNWYYAIAFCNKLSLLEGLTPAYTVNGVDFITLTYAQIPTSPNTNWDNATCDWDTNGYRLPTEMEWMWAAMGADKDARAGAIDAEGINRTGYTKGYAGQGYGNDTSLKNYAWDSSNSFGKTHPVGRKMPNELGLYDMSGNVVEWCWDWSASYPTGTKTDYRGAVSGSSRVSRGGNWSIYATSCSVAYRYGSYPYFLGDGIGFRILRPVQSP